MSRHHVEKITCPKCGAESEFLMWDSINTVLNPEMKEPVRTGEAFQFTCPKCGAATTVDYPFLYHQMDDRLMIFYAPADPVGTVEAIKEMKENPMFELTEDDGCLTRVVETRNQFLEKLLIFEEKLDDRIIEILKLCMMAYLKESYPDYEVDEMYFWKEDGTYRFVAKLADENWINMAFLQNIYDGLCDDYKDALQSDNDYVVDEHWAVRVMRKQRAK